MRKTNHFLKRFLVTVLTALMMLSVTPQLPMLDSVSTVEAATVKLSKKTLTLKKGKTKKLTLKNASGKIKWKSSKKSVATVSSKGVVTAKKAGKTTVSAVYKNKTYKCTVTVTDSSKQTTASVYWVPNGSVYHVSRSCPTLARSKTILSGTIATSGKPRACKVCSK